MSGPQDDSNTLPPVQATVTIIIEGDESETQTFVAERAHEIELGLGTPVEPGMTATARGPSGSRCGRAAMAATITAPTGTTSRDGCPNGDRPRGNLAFEGDGREWHPSSYRRVTFRRV